MRMFLLAVIEHHTRPDPGVWSDGASVRILGGQAARNLVMDLQDAGCRARFLIRDRDGKFPAMFGAIMADVGIKVVVTGVRVPRIWAESSTRTNMPPELHG
jgi:putative transposase